MRTTLRRSISIDLDLAEWAEAQAAAEHKSVSGFVNSILVREKARRDPVSEEVAVDKVKEGES